MKGTDLLNKYLSTTDKPDKKVLKAIADIIEEENKFTNVVPYDFLLEEDRESLQDVLVFDNETNQPCLIMDFPFVRNAKAQSLDLFYNYHFKNGKPVGKVVEE